MTPLGQTNITSLPQTASLLPSDHCNHKITTPHESTPWSQQLLSILVWKHQRGQFHSCSPAQGKFVSRRALAQGIFSTLFTSAACYVEVTLPCPIPNTRDRAERVRLSHRLISTSFPCPYRLSPVRVGGEGRAKKQHLTVKLRTHTEMEQARNGTQKTELILDVNKGGQGKRELWVKNSKLWPCSLLLARGEEKEFLDQLTGALGEEIQHTCIRCERDS